MKLRMIAFVMAFTLLGLGGLRAPASAQDGDGAGQTGIGRAVPVIGTEGGEIAQITVTELEDPFEAYDPGAEPERSYHYVLLHLEVENTGSRPYIFDAYGVTLQDADGFLYQQTFLSRPEDLIAADPEFTGEELEVGGVVSGVVGYQVLNGAELVRVVFQPRSDRLIFLADLTVEGAAPPPDDADATDAATPSATDATESVAVAVAADTEDADADADATGDTASGDTGAVGDTGTDDTGDTGDTSTDDTAAAVEISDAECDDVQAWLDDVTPALETFEETLNSIFADDPITPETLTDAATDLADAATSIRDSDPPSPLEDAATALADALDGYADAYTAAAADGADIPLADFGTAIDTSEADLLLDEVPTLADPVLDACGIDF